MCQMYREEWIQAEGPVHQVGDPFPEGHWDQDPVRDERLEMIVGLTFAVVSVTLSIYLGYLLQTMQ